VQDKRNNADRLGNVVKSARNEMRLTQLQLAERLGITVRYLKSIENSGQKPSYNLGLPEQNKKSDNHEQNEPKYGILSARERIENKQKPCR
jgi:DNA-binding XRE family transcriptional regulator